jgi:ribonuclease HI
MKIYFDGGCRPNPGPIDIAVVMRGQSHVRTAVAAGDSNEAEWLALLFALELAAGAGVDDPVFIGDSALVVEQARGGWKCRSAHLKPYLAAWRTRAAAFGRLRLKQVARSKNLAGIVLDARFR